MEGISGSISAILPQVDETSAGSRNMALSSDSLRDCRGSKALSVKVCFIGTCFMCLLYVGLMCTEQAESAF